MEYKVHTYTTQAAANAALALINAGEGYPRAGATTQSYTTVQQHDGQYIIFADEVTQQYINDNLQTINIPASYE